MFLKTNLGYLSQIALKTYNYLYNFFGLPAFLSHMQLEAIC